MYVCKAQQNTRCVALAQKPSTRSWQSGGWLSGAAARFIQISYAILPLRWAHTTAKKSWKGSSAALLVRYACRRAAQSDNLRRATVARRTIFVFSIFSCIFSTLSIFFHSKYKKKMLAYSNWACEILKMLHRSIKVIWANNKKWNDRKNSLICGNYVEMGWENRRIFPIFLWVQVIRASCYEVFVLI